MLFNVIIIIICKLTNFYGQCGFSKCKHTNFNERYEFNKCKQLIEPTCRDANFHEQCGCVVGQKHQTLLFTV
jgi:hypothetical protein